MDVDKAFRPIFKEIERKTKRRLSDTQKKKLLQMVGGEPWEPGDVRGGKAALREQFTVWKNVLLDITEKGLTNNQRTGKNNKWFERRVYIASFVLFRVHTPESLFIPLFKGTPIPKFRIDWKAMFKEWNQEHPSDQMTSIPIFSAEFYRILREKEVLAEILKREIVEENEFLQLQEAARKAIRENSFLSLLLAKIGGRP